MANCFKVFARQLALLGTYFPTEPAVPEVYWSSTAWFGYSAAQL